MKVEKIEINSIWKLFAWTFTESRIYLNRHDGSIFLARSVYQWFQQKHSMEDISLLYTCRFPFFPSVIT